MFKNLTDSPSACKDSVIDVLLMYGFGMTSFGKAFPHPVEYILTTSESDFGTECEKDSDSLCVIILAHVAQKCALLGVHKYSVSN